MESALLVYLLQHPESLVLVVAVAYWVRKEISERNGNRPTKMIREISDNLKLLIEEVGVSTRESTRTAEETSRLREIADHRMERVLQEIEHHRKDTDRLTSIAERMERKIDTGTFCPIRRERDPRGAEGV